MSAHVQFNSRIQVREVQKGPPKEDGDVGFAGAWHYVIQQYSGELAGASYEKEKSQLSAQTPPPAATVISGWHIKRDGLVYQGTTQHSSLVVQIKGNEVATQSGSVYILTNRDPEIKNTVIAITECYSDMPLWNSLDPLNESSIPLLFAAEMLVYGELSDRRADISRRMQELAKVTKVSIHSVNPVEWVKLLS